MSSDTHGHDDDDDDNNTTKQQQQQQHYDVIVDAIFGFSFHGTAPREPFATAIQQMVQLQQQSSSSSASSSILVSVDVPSGWDVDGGDLTGTGFHPNVLISLTAPKLSSKKFEGRHFVGGRFLPPAIAEKYGIRVSLVCCVSRCFVLRCVVVLHSLLFQVMSVYLFMYNCMFGMVWCLVAMNVPHG